MHSTLYCLYVLHAARPGPTSLGVHPPRTLPLASLASLLAVCSLRGTSPYMTQPSQTGGAPFGTTVSPLLSLYCRPTLFAMPCAQQHHGRPAPSPHPRGPRAADGPGRHRRRGRLARRRAASAAGAAAASDRGHRPGRLAGGHPAAVQGGVAAGGEHPEGAQAGGRAGGWVATATATGCRGVAVAGLPRLSPRGGGRNGGHGLSAGALKQARPRCPAAWLSRRKVVPRRP